MEKDFVNIAMRPCRIEEKLVTVYRHRRGKHFISERVPARVCKKWMSDIFPRNPSVIRNDKN